MRMKQCGKVLGQRFGLKVKEVLYHEKSEYQDILVFDSESYGRVLVLDGVIQVTEKDEFAYQEMITHLPLFAHRNPKSVLIVGGGDGGVLRELFMDAALYVKDQVDQFDVIIVDSSDPVGPAESLYTTSFYNTMKAALRKGGIICTQGECQWLHLPLIRQVMKNAALEYSSVRYAYTMIPTYPCGQIGFILAIKASDDDISKPNHEIPEEMIPQLRYYSKEIHEASFILPPFAKKELSN
ncbi:spermidine synthase [Blastocystis sp. subtype 4]|uniref:spermidine synthase n=1 Tax=Blastocystis sp. subtype 4 TaxID=944170 RepID=UPI000711C821|nr:spermidine synthase [Blastocystis sp. subtype 4]KNB41689.1 spermidine synthase [Blastocystis sp. subtype 4]|eukprot:XP_014525132.1 spermidine synthase [Blastocystis sp. subtype 4]